MWSMRGGVWHRLSPITQAAEAEGHRFKAVLSYRISLSQTPKSPFPEISTGLSLLGPHFKMAS